MPTTLTGLELQAWERAGFFIRRRAMDHPGLELCHLTLSQDLDRMPRIAVLPIMLAAPLHIDWFVVRLPRPNVYDVSSLPSIATLAVDLMGPHVGVISAAHPAPGTGGAWRRILGPPIDAPAAEQIPALARLWEVAVLRMAVEPDEALSVLPGSHIAPPPPEALSALERGDAQAPGAVVIRLAPGDVAFLSACLVARQAAPQQAAVSFRLAAVDKYPEYGCPRAAEDERLPSCMAFREAADGPPKGLD